MNSPVPDHRCIADIVNSLGNDSFFNRLLDWLKHHMSYDSAMVVEFSEEGRLSLLYSNQILRERWQTLEVYFAGMYILDPTYCLAVQDRAKGVFRFKDIVPPSFFLSEYYQQFYCDHGLSDEVNFIVPVKHTSLVVSIARLSRNPNFNHHELSLLQDLNALLQSLIVQHGRLATSAKLSLPARQHLLDALNCFGRSVLTEREQEVVGLMLRGYRADVVATKMSIGQETVKTHRKHIYQKMDISSQAELFSLFYSSVANADGQLGEDPFSQFSSPAY